MPRAEGSLQDFPSPSTHRRAPSKKKKTAPAERPQVSVPLDCRHLSLQHNRYVHHPIKMNLWHFRFLHGLNGGSMALRHNWHINDLSNVLYLWNLDSLLWKHGDTSLREDRIDLPNYLMRHTVARVNHDARRPLRSAQRQTSSDRHVHDGNVKRLEHELRHAFLAGQGHVHGGHVERREREGARGSRGILRRVPGTHTPLRAGGCPTAHLLCVPFLPFFGDKRGGSTGSRRSVGRILFHVLWNGSTDDALHSAPKKR